jgi:TRAP-type mannitol/chloroaromatic compound transport system substrate-binding protein
MPASSTAATASPRTGTASTGRPPCSAVPPPFGWDSQGFLAWFYRGGGEVLYQELVNGILRLNVTGFLCFPMPTQPLGWFGKEIASAAAFKGLKYRSHDLSAELFKEMGAAVVLLPGGEIIRAMDRRLLDGAEFHNPSSDLLLGLPEVSKVYMLGSNHRQAGAFEIMFNKRKFEALPAELQAILRQAALAASTEQLALACERYAKDVEEIERRGIKVIRTGEQLLNDQLAAWDRVIAEQSKEPFFAKVIESQKAWVKRTVPYLLANNLDSAALQSAYRHFFG